MKNALIHALLLVVVFYASSNGQNKTILPKGNTNSQTKDVVISTLPKTITRTIIQDRKGNIWIAAFDGVFRYDGTSFTNVMREVSSARFFSVLEDKKGNLWFGSIGSGVYCYDGKSFQNFTTKQGLAGNQIVCIYEDKIGHIWFGTESGASRYDGTSFRTFTTEDVNSILEDKTGKFWFGTRGYACTYDGKKYTVVTTKDGEAFKNVRSIIEDKEGTIWLGGADGLWRYDGSSFTNFTRKFVGCIIEDNKGNIWTSSESDTSQDWSLSRYEKKSLFITKTTVTETKKIFGIFEDNEGSIWFGADGVHRYNGNSITDFK